MARRSPGGGKGEAVRLRDAQRVAERNGDLFGGRTTAKAILAAAKFNREFQKVLDESRREESRRKADADAATES